MIRWDRISINNTIINHFQSIYSTGLIKCSLNIPSICSNVLSTEAKEIIGRPLTKEEIKNVMFSFKPLKSPGPNGLHLLFF